MRIKKFYISYGGYFGGYTEISKKGRELIYYSPEDPGPSILQMMPENASRIQPTDAQWRSFAERIRPFASSWKKEYWAEVCDGTQWEVKIVIDDLSFKSWGSNDFPEDFDVFLRVLSEFTGIKEITDWYGE